MPALLSLIPGKDWFYAALIALLLSLGLYERHHLLTEGAQRQEAVVQAASAKVQADAAKQTAAVAAAYAGTVTGLQETIDAQTQAAALQHNTDSQRLRDYDAYRRAHPALGSPTGGLPAAGEGSESAAGADASLGSLEQVALGLAGAAANARDALNVCMADRAALVGK